MKVTTATAIETNKIDPTVAPAITPTNTNTIQVKGSQLGAFCP